MSNPTFNIEVSGDLLKKLPQLAAGSALVNRLAAVMKEQNALTVSHIQEKYMSFPKDQPPRDDGLRTQSNRLRNSLRAADVDISGGKLTSGIGSNVIYAAILEFGGMTKAHDIVARNADFLAFIPGGGTTGKFFSKADLAAKIKGKRGKARKAAAADYFDEQGVIFRKRVHHPGSIFTNREYVQRGIRDRLNDYNQAFSQEITKTIQS